MHTNMSGQNTYTHSLHVLHIWCTGVDFVHVKFFMMTLSTWQHLIHRYCSNRGPDNSVLLLTIDHSHTFQLVKQPSIATSQYLTYCLLPL